MKVRITDLMDLYQDPKSPFGEEGMAASGQKEAIEVKQSKHAFGWREGLSLAAALAVVVLAGFGVKKLLQRSPGPAGPGTSTTVMSSPEPSQNESIDPTGNTEYDLAQLQALNPYVSYFAEQNILHRDEDFSLEYDVVSFLHIWFKLHHREAIVYADVDAEKPEFSGSFETLTLEQMNQAADQLLGMQLSPAEGTDYTVLRGDNYAQHERYADGKFFFPAADGDQYRRFALCTQASSFDGGQPNSVGVSFKVYEPTEKYPGEPDREELQKLYIDVASAMESRGELRLCQTGTATLQKTETGYRMLDYNAQDVLGEDVADVLSILTLRSEQTDPDGVATVRELLLRQDGSFGYREGEPFSEYSNWAAGNWISTAESGKIRLEYRPTGELGEPLGDETWAVYRVSQDDRRYVMTLEEGDGLGRDQAGWTVSYTVMEETEEGPIQQPSESDELLAELSEYLDSADKDWVWLHRALSCGTFTSKEEGEALLAALPEKLPRINLSYRALRPLGNDMYQLEYGRLNEGVDKEIIWTAQFRWTDKEFTLLSNHVATWNPEG